MRQQPGRAIIFVFSVCVLYSLGRRKPREILLLDRGKGELVPCIVQEGVPIHEAKAGELSGNDLPDAIGKSYAPEKQADVWFNETPR